MAEYPHCNMQVVHAPGECYYCDKFPHLQRAREASGGPFTPNESNGWSGNVAAPQGAVHTHMGFSYIVGSGPEGVIETPFDDPNKPCEINFKRGWFCTRGVHATGPCALVPKWWNISGVRAMKK